MPMGGEILIQLNILDNNQLSIRFIDQVWDSKRTYTIPWRTFYSIKEEGLA